MEPLDYIIITNKDNKQITNDNYIVEKTKRTQLLGIVIDENPLVSFPTCVCVCMEMFIH